jgi:predicted O-methyltransferase YrrM
MMPDFYPQLEIPAHDRETALQPAKAAFLYDFLQNQGPENTLETGLGYGVSAAYILSATKGSHYAMDPLQGSLFHNLGLTNLATLQLASRLHFEPAPAHQTLPRLLAEGLQVDFALIDGDHKFDSAFVDFYFCDLLLAPGGYIAIDDSRMAAVASLIAWIQTNKGTYEVQATGVQGLTLWRKVGVDERPWRHFVPFGTHTLCRSLLRWLSFLS